uniref:Phosphoenolpyruvate synthase n=1 Tax=Pristionchus pacificus TaxID=54126 RepID=A0A8R1Y5Q4_PRIPA
MNSEQLCEYFTQFILFVYSLIFRLITRVKKRSFTPYTDAFLDTISVQPEEWKLEGKQEKDEQIAFDATTIDGETSLFISIHTTGECLETFVHLQSGGRTLICPTTLARMSAGSGSIFLAGPLRLEMREPFRSWRIQYKGLMTDESTGEQVFVTLGGWWKPTSDAKWRYNFVDTNTLDDQLLSRPFCLVKHSRTAKNVLDTSDLTQWGEYHCELSIGGDEKKESRLRGLRTRYRDEVQQEQQFSVYFDHGDRLLWSRRQCEQGSITHGFMARGDQRVVPLTLHNKDSIYGLNYGDKDIINFEQASLPYAVSKISPPITFSYKTATGEVVSVTRLTVRHLKYDGQAIFIQRNAAYTKGPAPTLPPIPEYTAYGVEREMPVLRFSHRACQDSSITGGKAANLARLTSIANGFTVPRGISVTTTAFKSHLNAHSNIKKLIEKLGNQGNDLDTCLHLGEQIGAGLAASIMSEELKREITDTLLIETGSETRFAVRSSAVGEDGSELSSAGQLESYMEVEINDVPEKVLLCWASNYRKECLSYRKQYGQPINPLMGVVVQRMIVNGVAGVMFTCDPVRGDPSRVVINALKGKGEDVVSGTVTPDTVVLRKMEGTVIEQSEPCCLVEIAQARLLKAGLYLEGLFGGPQDVEFIVNLTTNEINVVQSRDVTGRERESDFELRTEFNSSNLTDHECYTMANVGEVMPEPLTPLFVSSSLKPYDSALMSKNEAAVRCNRHYQISFTVYNNRIVFNHGELFLRMWEQNEKDRISEFALGGQELFTKEMFEMGKQRYERLHQLFPLMRLANIIKIVVHDSYVLSKLAHEKEELCRSLIAGDTPAERLANLEKQRRVHTDMIIAHMGESMFSSFTYVVIAMIVRGADHGDFSPEMLSDIAAIFSSGNEVGAISADVPTALKNLAIALVEDGVNANQLEDEKEGLELIKSGKNSSAHYERFMSMHGHRGPGELDYIAQTWSDHPELLVHTVKGMVATPSALKKGEAHAEIDSVLDSLRSVKVTGAKRWFMKMIVRQSHRAVGLREECKNLLVKGSAHMRANIAALGTQLVDQGFLPEKELVFFFTLPELHHFIKSRAPRFISRAMRRRKIFPSFRGKRYEYFWQGPGHEIAEPTADLLTSSSLSGTTVCEGLVVGRARVAKSIDDARDTQPGEILITTYTDICWSPLFPIVKGLVTEVGGLLSHGAVVAREYGLPSLIAVKFATDVFKTGDLVELNATKGTISKVVEKEDDK